MASTDPEGADRRDHPATAGTAQEAGPLLVFGYGSLTVARGGARRRHRLLDHARSWGVAMDNRRTLPNYKYYVDARSGRRPSCFVAFLDIAPAPGSTVNGVLLETTPERLRALDARERNYARVDVTGLVDPAPDGEVHAYVGTPQARDRFRRGTAARRCVVDRQYLAAVRTGFASLGGGALEDFDRSTAAPDVPVRPLLRVDT